MGLFNKKEEIPTIPPAPSLATFPTTDAEKKDLPELPTFPSNENNENLNQEMVKSAVSETSSPGEEEVQAPANTEAPGAGLIPPKEEMAAPIPAAPTPASPAPIQAQTTPGSAPIFVRVDKFQAAQGHFQDIKEKVAEISDTLAKIKEVKTKEDEELASWNSEIEKLKFRLSEIDQDIFSQI